MPTHEIARSEWRTFFDTFSQLHEGWLTTVEVSGGDVPGNQLEAEDVPFLGISADAKGSEPDSIALILGREPSGEVIHIIHDATRVQYQRSDAGGGGSLEIESAEGDVTIVKLRAAAGTELPLAAGG